MDGTKIIPIKCGMANVYLLIGEKVVIVDTGLKGSTDTILAAMKNASIKPEDVSLIILTHAHPDHCLNTKNLKEVLGVPVAINSIEAKFIEAGEFAPVVPLNLIGKLVYRSLKSIHEKHTEYVKPEIVFDKELDLSPFGIKGKAVITPGHSYGNTSIFLENGCCLAGDLVLAGTVKKMPILPLFAVDIELLKSSLRSILNSEVKVIYSSHGPAWEKSVVQKAIGNKLW